MKELAQARYSFLQSDRQPFLDSAREAAALTLPYLLTETGLGNGARLPIPWQSVGAKGVNVLASKLMLSLFPVNTSFFKLQINDAELASVPDLTPEMRSEIDLSLSKMERMIMQQIAETSDRVQLHTALKHLVVTGNALVFAGKKALKVFPLDRYVVNRDGDGNVLEIITEESVSRQLLPKTFQAQLQFPKDVNAPGEDGPKFGTTGASDIDEALVYTWAKLQDGQWAWHQEADGKLIPGSNGSAPKSLSPWIPLRFNVVDGEDYGRGRVEEFMGDLKSLEGLMQALVEGSAAAAKVVFLVSPSSTTKPKTLADAGNGAVIQGRADDVSVVEVGKTADFKTVLEMINILTQRLADAFLVLSVRQSERTTAMEVQAVVQELNEQLGGIFGNLTTELLHPYLNRKLHILQRSKKVPTLPKELVTPVVVAGLNGIGRGQDRQALVEFITTIGQGMGPEAIAQYVNPLELLKRFAAASGIDAMNLIKTQQDIEQEQQQAQQAAATQQLMGQAAQLAKTPLAENLLNGTQAAGPQPGGPVQGGPGGS